MTPGVGVHGHVISRRAVLVLYAAGFVTAFGAHAVAANLGRYATGRHTSLLELGGLLAIYDGAEVVLKPLFGALSDRIGPRPVLIGGLIGFAVASAGFVVAGQTHWLVVARFWQGASAAAFSPAASTLVAHAGVGGRRGRSFGGYGGAKGLGYLLGPIGGGALIATGGYRLLFAILAVIALTVAAFARLYVPVVSPTQRARETLIGLATRLTRPEFLKPVAVLAAATAAMSAGIGFLPVVGQRAHLGPLVTGAIISLLATIAALVQPHAGAALDDRRFSAVRYGSAALLLAAGGFLLTALFPHPAVLIITAVLIGTGIGIATPLGFAALADAAPTGRMGQTMGAGEIGRELGDAGGPLLVGALSIIGLSFGLAGLGTALLLISTTLMITSRHRAVLPAKSP
jgi:MFS transporter, DHA1 family, tetracycline resistance protein